jgi:hypothetical protein
MLLSNPKMIQSFAMRSLRPISLVFLGLALPVFAADKTPPVVTPASSFAAVEVHPEENLAIAVEPYETKDKQSIFHIDYAKYNVIPVRLIITNLGDKPVSLRDARILFETAAGERIQAADPEDVERMLSMRTRSSTMPLPGPIPGIKLKPKNKNKDVEEDFRTFEYQALAVEPHTTRAGFLFYIVPLADPLKGADLYLNKLRNSEGVELFPFQIPFDKYLKAKAGGGH